MAASAPTEFELRRLSYYLRERPDDPMLKAYLEELGFDGTTWEALQDPAARQHSIEIVTENMARLVYDAIKSDDAVRVVQLYDAALPIYQNEFDIIRMSLGEGGVLKGSPRVFSAMAALVEANELHEFILELFEQAHTNSDINPITIINVLRKADYAQLDDIVERVVWEELTRFKRNDDNYLLDLVNPNNLEWLRQSGVNLNKIQRDLEKFYVQHYSEDDGVEYEEAKTELFDTIAALQQQI